MWSILLERSLQSAKRRRCVTDVDIDEACMNGSSKRVYRVYGAKQISLADGREFALSSS